MRIRAGGNSPGTEASEPRSRSEDSARDRMDDFACIDDCLRGRTEAFSVLVDRHQDLVYSLVSRMISDRESILDLAQETFLLAFRGLRSFQRDSSFTTWLYRIAVNVCRSERRRRERQRRIGTFGAGRPANPEDERELADDGGGPLDAVEEREREKLLREAMDGIEDEYREIVVLRDFHGLPYQEIAEVLEIPIGTVRSRLFRARAEIRRRLERVLGGTDR